MTIPPKLISNAKLPDGICRYGGYLSPIHGSTGYIHHYPECKRQEGTGEECVSEFFGKAKEGGGDARWKAASPGGIVPLCVWGGGGGVRRGKTSGDICLAWTGG